MRLLVTYAGKGTEWLPDEFVDRNAYENGLPNESILKNPSRSKFINTWDVAIFRGGSDGLLHRSPDAALNGTSIISPAHFPSSLSVTDDIKVSFAPWT